MLAGCAKSLTRTAFNDVRVNTDHKADVRARLGKPRVEFDDYWYYNNPDTDDAAQIYFDGAGLVVDKRWGDQPGGAAGAQPR